MTKLGVCDAFSVQAQWKRAASNHLKNTCARNMCFPYYGVYPSSVNICAKRRTTYGRNMSGNASSIACARAFPKNSFSPSLSLLEHWWKCTPSFVSWGNFLWSMFHKIISINWMNFAISKSSFKSTRQLPMLMLSLKNVKLYSPKFVKKQNDKLKFIGYKKKFISRLSIIMKNNFKNIKYQIWKKKILKSFYPKKNFLPKKKIQKISWINLLVAMKKKVQQWNLKLRLKLLGTTKTLVVSFRWDNKNLVFSSFFAPPFVSIYFFHPHFWFGPLISMKIRAQ